MSDNVLRLIPTEPSWLPTRAHANAAAAALRAIAPRAADVRYELTTEIGENFEAMRCHVCGADIPMEWWTEKLDETYAASRFADLAIVTPCCASPASLNDLDYVWPQGFSRWTLEAWNTDRRLLTDDERRRIADALGHDVREIWTHI